MKKKTSQSIWNVWELQCLVDDLADFLNYQCFFTLGILCDEKDMGLEHEKNLLLDTIYITFFKKNFYGRLKLMTFSYTCRE